jgi:hypothetical protein
MNNAAITKILVRRCDRTMVFRGKLSQDQQVGGIDDNQHNAVVDGERSFDDDDGDVQQRNQQPDHFHGVVFFQFDLAEWLAGAAPMEKCRSEVDQRPAGAGKKAQRAGEVG